MKRILNKSSKMIIYTLILNLFGVFTSAQSTFQKTYSLQISGLNLDNVVRDVIIDNQENFVYTGYVKEFVSQETQGFLYKTDKDGNILWYKGYYDSLQINSTVFGSLIEDSDGGYILNGSKSSTSTGVIGLLTKVDSGGNIQWVKEYQDLLIGKIAIATNGDIIGVGNVNNNNIGTLVDVSLIRIDSFGNFLWGKSIGTPGSDHGNFLTATFDNGCIFIGMTNLTNFPTGRDIYVSKFDSSGNHLWSKKLGGNDDDGAFFYARVKRLSDGNLIIAAPTKSFGFGDYDILVIKIDNSGNTIWTKVHGTSNSEIPYAIQELQNGDLLIAGGISYPGFSSSEAMMIRLNSSGNVLWGKTYTNLNFNIFSNLLNFNNYFLLIGETTDGGSISNTEIYTVKTDTAGISGCNETSLLLSSANIGINSQSISDSVFDLGSLINSSINVFDYTQYLIEHTLCFVGIDEYDIKDNFIIYPNPNSGKFTIKNQYIFYNEMKVYNLLGELVYTSYLQKENTNIDISFLTSGLYFLNLVNSSTYKQTTQKIIINH